MNIENTKRLADHLRTLGQSSHVKFSMASYYIKDRECGTVACLAGHACLLAGKGERWLTKESTSNVEIHKAASDWLGLDHRVASNLFYPDLSSPKWRWSPKQAAAHLDKMIEEWS
jgi:hypothetical protein